MSIAVYSICQISATLNFELQLWSLNSDLVDIC